MTADSVCVHDRRVVRSLSCGYNDRAVKDGAPGGQSAHKVQTTGEHVVETGAFTFMGVCARKIMFFS